MNLGRFKTKNQSQYVLTLRFLLQVLSPYNSEDAKGLLKSAIRDDNPGKNCMQ